MTVGLFFQLCVSDFANKTAELTNWLINAFNGEWIKVGNPQPNGRKREEVARG